MPFRAVAHALSGSRRCPARLFPPACAGARRATGVNPPGRRRRDPRRGARSRTGRAGRPAAPRVRRRPAMTGPRSPPRKTPRPSPTGSATDGPLPTGGAT
ncbi:hypothetical protein B9S64_08260 [Streptomyces sp. SM18]|nr:hypothetical protein B9S64_08260 [Streptomyces sp. SM18]